VLDPDEVKQTSYVCNGASPHGQVSGVAEEPAGANCPAGGLKLTSGADDNGNGVLEGSEIETTKYVCNGESSMGGPATLVDVASEPMGAHCVAAGLKITSGPDTNQNGTLDAAEVTDTSYVCNGDPVAANGSSPVVTAYMDDRVNVRRTEARPRCGRPRSPRRARAGARRVERRRLLCEPRAGAGLRLRRRQNDGYLTLTAVAHDAANSGLSSYFYCSRTSPRPCRARPCTPSRLRARTRSISARPRERLDDALRRVPRADHHRVHADLTSGDLAHGLLSSSR
jgi:hypothetical protein